MKNNMQQEFLTQTKSLNARFEKQASKSMTSQAVTKLIKIAELEFEKLKTKAIEKTGNEPACAEGCNFCCNLIVSARAYEIVRILEYIEKRCSKDERASVFEKADANTRKMQALSEKEIFETFFKCPLLCDNGLCLCYEVRPFNCRKFFSKSTKLCKQSFEIKPVSADKYTIFQIEMDASSVSHALDMVFLEKGYDCLAYDLSRALFEDMNKLKAGKRWRKGKKAFSKEAISKDENMNLSHP